MNKKYKMVLIALTLFVPLTAIELHVKAIRRADVTSIWDILTKVYKRVNCNRIYSTY